MHSGLKIIKRTTLYLPSQVFLSAEHFPASLLTGVLSQVAKHNALHFSKHAASYTRPWITAEWGAGASYLLGNPHLPVPWHQAKLPRERLWQMLMAASSCLPWWAPPRMDLRRQKTPLVMGVWQQWNTAKPCPAGSRQTKALEPQISAWGFSMIRGKALSPRYHAQASSVF